jgi:hypothetical protein
VSKTLAAVHALGSLAERLSSRSRALPKECESAKVLHLIGAAATPPAPPPSDFLEGLRRQLTAASRAKRLSELTSRQLRYAPWLLWNGKSPAANLPGLLTMILDRAASSRADLRRLIQAYLRDFSIGAPGIPEAAQCIRKQLANADPRLENWRQAQREVQLFDPVKGPLSLAARLLSEEDPGIILARYKLEDEILARGGYMLAVEDAVRARAPPMLLAHGAIALERILKIIAPSKSELRFESRRAETARALLAAWLTGRREPERALQEPVRRVLLDWLRDPRLPVNKQRWRDVGERETSLVRQWLSRASLNLFFRLIDDQHTRGMHWPYRRAFWFAYLELGAIEDAWLALGGESYHSAHAVRELGGAYGRLLGDSRQSALLLRIGRLVISEFTHIGKVRAWLYGSREAPQLGQQQYSRHEFMGECLQFPVNPYRGKGGNSSGTGLSHINSQQGYWQGSVAALIESHTGFRTTPRDWWPR